MEELQTERYLEELLHSDTNIRNNNYVKSASSSHLHQLDSSISGGGGGSVGGGSDSGIGSHKELSRSLDCLDIVPMPSNGEHLMVGDQRRKSQTLPSFPSPNLRQFKKLSLGSAFGTKNLGLGRKFSSLIPTSSERYQSSYVQIFCLGVALSFFYACLFVKMKIDIFLDINIDIFLDLRALN